MNLNLKLKVRIITEQDARESDFDLFRKGWEFEDGLVHIVFALNHVENDIDVCWAYAWNLDSLEEVETSDHIEIVLMEALAKGQGFGTKLIDLLKEKYQSISVANVENERFWKKMGFSDRRRSEIDHGHNWCWKR